MPLTPSSFTRPSFNEARNSALEMHQGGGRLLHYDKYQQAVW